MKTSTLLYCLFLALLLSSSCVTQKKCSERFPPSRDTLRIIQTKDSIIVKDTTIFSFIKGKDTTIFKEIPYPVSVTTEKLRSETSLAWAEAWIEKSILMLKLVQKDTTIMTQLKNWKKEAYYWKEEYTKIKEVPPPLPPERYIPKIYKYSFWILLAIAIVTGLKYAKKFDLLGLIKKLIK